MDIRYRFKSKIEKAPRGLKIKYYQARYDGRILGQIICLLQTVAVNSKNESAGANSRMKPSVVEKQQVDRKKRFADYGRKQVYTPVSLMPQLYQTDIISFDIFDTLLRRTVSCPTDVFARMEQCYAIPGFAKCRIAAEKEARQYAYTASGTTEIAIEDIYRSMFRMDNSVSVQAKLEQYICAELEMEKECCIADQGMRYMVNRLLTDGKRVIAVSDMYLHKEQVKKLLYHCGYSGGLDIYVSCDYRAGKSDGRLFPFIMKEIGKEKSLIHIGDNFYADVYRQKALGIRAIHYL